MNDETNETEGPAHADASIDLRMEGPNLRINISSPEDHLTNKAVHFAHWIGRNLGALQTMASEDFLAQERIRYQARTIAELAGPAPVGPVIEAPHRKLLGPDGKPVQ